jgi:NADH-quinone oxidoreductase subunit M
VPELIAGRAAFAAQQNLAIYSAFPSPLPSKCPLFPFHSWLPDAHTEAPTAGSIILAGVLLKMGTYGFMRFNLPLFPQASFKYAPVIAVLAIIGIIYGAIVSFAQQDVKKLVAYSSISHLALSCWAFSPLTRPGIQGRFCKG